MPEAQLLPYIDELIATTKIGKIPWTQSNPTVYLWDVPHRARTTLQQAITGRNRHGAAPEPVKVYIFNVVDLSRGGVTPRIQTQAIEDTPLGKKMSELFSVITESYNQSNLDFLKSLLPNK